MIRTLLPVYLFFAAAAIGQAQSLRATVLGTITDSGKNPLPGAVIRVIENGTARERSITSGPAGEFTLTQLAPGTYHVEISKTAFRTHEQDLELRVNQELRLEIPLLAANRTEKVDVVGTREMLRTENASLGSVIDNLQVTSLPLDGRNFFELSLLLPGTVPAAPGSAGSVRGDFAINVNGAREDANNFLLDGIYNGDPKLNGTAQTPPVDAIREFEVLTNGYDNSFGRNAGAQVNVVVKSGTNGFHGAAYEFFRHSAISARNFFAQSNAPDPTYRRNQFGAALGGPIKRDRTFFFADYEGRRVDEAIVRTSNVPTALERNGDFSRSPLSLIPIDPFAQAPFPGFVIPANRIHPVGKAIAALYPLPNRNVANQNYVSAPSSTDRDDRFDARVDHKLGSRDDLFARYSFGDRTLFEPFAGPSYSPLPGYGNNVPRRSQNTMLSETHVFTPALINEVRMGFNRVAIGVLQENQLVNLNKQVGLPAISSNARDYGLSLISLTGFGTLGHEYNSPQQSVTNTWQVNDNATWVRGSHLVKFGFDFRVLQQNAYRDVQSRGFLNFLGLTGNALSELLQGLPSVTGGARLDNPQYLRTRSYNFYGQDTWRVRQNFTLTYGLRYEFNQPPVDKFDRANIYDPSTGTLAKVGSGNVPRAGYRADRNNFAPRIGLSWAPGNGRTAIRSGYGVYYDLSSLAPGEGLYFSPPYFDLRLYFPIPEANYFLTLSDPFPANFPFPLPSSALTIQRDFRTAYMQQWNLSVERQVGRSRLIEVAYAGSKGTKLLAGRDLNQAGPSAAAINPRPNFYYADITTLESRGLSNYNSLQARFEQRYSAGLSVLGSYTWAKSIDDSSGFFTSAGDPNFPQDSRNVRLERGRSNFDVRHRASIAYTYDLPFGRSSSGAIKQLASGWQTNGIWTFQTGRPFTVMLLPDLDNSGTGRGNLGFGNNDRPNRIASGASSNPTPDIWLNPAAFAMPVRGTFGNSGRNILDGPGLATINASVLKNTSLREGLNLQFRAEAFNLLNRTNFDLPDIYYGSPTFGRISSAQSPRRLQFGVKLLF